jgi:mRNA interferase MazF
MRGEVRRGEVWWAQLPKPAGRRPVVLVSRDEAYAVRALISVVPVTTHIRAIPVEVPLGREEGLPRRCVANADTITTIPKATLAEYAGVLAPEKVGLLDAAIRFALGTG